MAFGEGRKKKVDRSPDNVVGQKNNKKTKKAKKIDTDIASTDSGSSLTYPLAAGQLKKGGMIVMKDKFPCKVEALSTSKTGKHGHAKINITAKDIFTGKKYADICPSTHSVKVPFVKRVDYNYMGSIDDMGYVSLMTTAGVPVNNVLQLDDSNEIDKNWRTELTEQAKKAETENKIVSISVISAMEKSGIAAIKLMDP
mmetsp:Transcript_420/g.771  ORF Transcript_420/g.771 Transcript_420/m.771 type:complete len:198 (+) Transcript_420:54-647(+)|eukprot:CAMPEP_0117425458 /NCGR_PEP_ID=MMETSP0758-20121206/5722_1 /TAXON_ID=63605 /ORGANISM="Percolomonas cosmopolitus, Strain AE-1 (ATCC 50343)" /LENGTH=197 /DNA_ID=CAMNT_0005209947 /DNA_START=57 /DNA_END=650 /DNA_ORIENTATION=-